MINSIQQSCEHGAKRLTDIFKTYTDNLTKIAEMVYGVTDEVTRLGCSMIAEEWETYDELLRESCLLDQLMGLGDHVRITEDAEAGIFKEAAESSYRKGGANASINGNAISKETVMNKLHRLDFPVVKPDEKKEFKTIYIDADEDHVSLQYLEHKGDIRKPRTNTVMPRIIYVYEGMDSDEEGHVSHVYAGRMSSRPLGWCRTGADKMSRLRIYRQNQGNMLELVRFQKKEIKQVSGAEEVIYSATDMIKMENANRRKLLTYFFKLYDLYKHILRHC